MGSEVILVEEFFLVFFVFRYKLLNSLLISVAAHILGEISVGFRVILFVRLVNPGEEGVLSDIVIAAASDFIEPLQILIVRYCLIDPSQRLRRFNVVCERVLLYFCTVLYGREKILGISIVKVEHYLPSVFHKNIH